MGARNVELERSDSTMSEVTNFLLDLDEAVAAKIEPAVVGKRSDTSSTKR
jgi:hypothetical protein